MDSQLWIQPDFLTTDMKLGVMAELQANDKFFQRPIGAYGVPIPRGQMAFGEGTYTYGKLVIQSVPPPSHINKIMSYIREKLDLASVKFVLVNKYETGRDSVGLHTDNEKDLNPGDPIFSLSLGTPRRFIIRPHTIPKTTKPNVEYGPYNPGACSLFSHPSIPYSKISVEVEAGDNILLVMAGSRFQSDFCHEVPKQPKVTGIRYNLTFRSMK